MFNVYWRAGQLTAQCALAVCGCVAAGHVAAQSVALALFSTSNAGVPPAPWRIAGLPGQGKSGATTAPATPAAPAAPISRFDIIALDGQKVLRVQTNSSYGNLVHALPGTSLAPGTQLRWRWRLDQSLVNADLRHKRGDDSPLKVCLLFDVPLAKLGFVDRSVLSFARSVSGEKLPSATLCYVWDHTLPTGTLLNNAYTSRVRMLVLGSGDKNLGQWVTYQRDVAADFKLAFGGDQGGDRGGEKGSDGLPLLDAVLVGADSDNAGGQSLGYVGDVTLSP